MRHRVVKPAETSETLILRLADTLWKEYLATSTGEALDGVHDTSQAFAIALRDEADSLAFSSLKDVTSRESGAFNVTVILAIIARQIHTRACEAIADEEEMKEMLEASSLGSPAAKKIQKGGEGILWRLRRRRH